jgi:hypothetical protein
LPLARRSPIENKDVIKYNSLTSLTSVSDQKSAYATLSPSEKTSMWQIHIDNMIKENEYNSVQLKLITEAKELLTLAKDVNDNDFVNSNEFIIWNHKAAEAFTKQEMFNLFVSLSGDVTQNLVDDGKNSCNCATQSDWCNFPAPPPDSWFYSSCDGGSNCKTKSGCGTLWRYDCNNTCEVHSIIPV